MSFVTEYTSTTYVADLAHMLLASAAATLATPPSIQYINMGKPAADGCDRLIVWVLDMHLASPRNQTARGGGTLTESRSAMEQYGVLPAVDFTIQLLRCGVPQPTGDLNPVLPTAAELDAFGTAQITDGWALYHGLVNAWRAGTLFGGLNPAPHTVLGMLTPVEPSGGIAGWQLPLKVSLY